MMFCLFLIQKMYLNILPHVRYTIDSHQYIMKMRKILYVPGFLKLVFSPIEYRFFFKYILGIY